MPSRRTVSTAVPKLLGIEGRYALTAVESLLRLGILVGYMWLLSRNKEVKRTFSYHGAEHMVIHAFEHGVDLVPSEVRRFDRRHPRCGTAFLLIVVLVGMVAHILIGDVSWPVLMLTRILGLPIIAGVAYEALRLGARFHGSLVMRALMAPGIWLQKITTQQPDDSQIEVAIASFDEVLRREDEAAGAAG